MKCDRDDCFPFDFETNGIPLVLKLNGKLSQRSLSFNQKEKGNLLF